VIIAHLQTNITLMLRNLFKTALRNISRDKVYSLINVLGLTIGITSSIFLLLYVLDELSYDKYHTRGREIYRVITTIKEVDDEFTWVVAQIPFAPTVRDKFPEVEKSVRFIGTGRVLYKKDDLKFYEEEIFAADSAVFEVFSYNFIEGDAATALHNPNSIVLTKDMAVKYFGSDHALGKTLQAGSELYQVTGVIDNIPKNSHFTFDGLVSIATLNEQARTGNWGNFGVFTYLYAPNLQDPSTLETKLSAIYDEYCAPIFKQYGITFTYKLQRITDIHLHSRYEGESNANGDIKYVYIFSAVAIFMLIIASINYMNLATARSARRSREVGIRKVVGSHRMLIISQFIIESLLLTIIAFILSLIFVIVLLPYFNDLLGKEISINFLRQPIILFGLAGIIIFVGFLGGSYPAFYLSSFNPAMVLKSKVTSRGGNAFLRKGLVVLQFSISIVMLVCTWLVYDQLQYLRNKDLGFDKEHIVRMSLSTEEMRQNYNVLRNKLLQLPEVVNVATAGTSPGYGVGKNLINVEDQNGEMVERGIDMYGIDYDYLSTLGFHLIDGRDFSKDVPSDTSTAVIVTEAMIKRMGWDNAIGKRFSFINQDGQQGDPLRVIGVVKDYHHASLYDIIEPILFLPRENNRVLHIKIDGRDIKGALVKVESVWNSVQTDQPFEYTFLDAEFQEQYLNDERRGQIFTLFAGLTMAIACLGLLGLASYTTEQRTKEISIRKVMGANVSSLVYLVSREFIILVFISIIIGLPIAHYFMEKWLQNFAFAMDINWISFLLVSIVALVITFTTVSFHTVKAALANPVDALKEE
jgi:putative ABC transport system permease protein